MRVFMGRQELGRAIHLVEHQGPIPGPDGDIGNAVVRPCNERVQGQLAIEHIELDRKSTRLNSSHSQISYAVFCLKKKKIKKKMSRYRTGCARPMVTGSDPRSNTN